MNSGTNKTSGKANVKSILVFAVIIFVVVALIMSCSNNGHAPGYGNPNKCTICGKPATHKYTNYGYCDKHWMDMVNSVSK